MQPAVQMQPGGEGSAGVSDHLTDSDADEGDMSTLN